MNDPKEIAEGIGDRDPIIENLKAELERVKAERDEAVRLLKPFVGILPTGSEDKANHGFCVSDNHCRAARAFVEKVKQA